MNDISERLSRKIKVIHVITRFDKGGSAENTFLTVRDLDGKQYDVWLVMGPSYESQMGKAERDATERNLTAVENAGVRTVFLPELVRSIQPFKDVQALVALVRLFKQVRPDIVHTHTSKAGLLGRWAAFSAGVPLIVHTPHGHVFWGYFGSAATRLFVLLERFTARFTHRLVMLTDQERADHLRFRIAPARKFTVIHSGVDFRPFESALRETPASFRDDFGIPQTSVVLGTVGRLTAIKGHRFLLEAVALLAPHRPHLTCIFLGDGELRQDLAHLASTLGIQDRVHFLGWRPDVARVLSCCDIFVFPSLNEGMGKALVEAMALGKPIIASAVGGITNLVAHGENGFLVPPGNAETLAKSIELLYLDSIGRREMGARGKNRAAAYSSDLMVERIESLYRELLHDGLAKMHRSDTGENPEQS